MRKHLKRLVLKLEKVITAYLHPNKRGYYMIVDVDGLYLINLL